MSDDWSLPGDWLASTRASYPGVALASILAEAPRFKDHYLANDAEFADWQPKWRNWLRQAFRGKEVTPSDAKAAEQALAGRVRLHCDDAVFKEIVRMRKGKHPPTDRDGCWTFDESEVDHARTTVGRAA